jgi:hypothetical protein
MIRILIQHPDPSQAGQALNFEGLVWHNANGIVGHALIQQEVTIDIITDDGVVKQSEWRDVEIVHNRDDG